MTTTAISSVRRFNRIVTQRVGALSDGYLASGRPLGAARVLWEIGNKGTDARSLRLSLDLDSGYLSRLLRSLEDDGLISVDPDPADRRVRMLCLTEHGVAERQLLDQRSDDLAASFLAPLNPEQQRRLIESMETVVSLLTSGLVEVTIEDPTSDAAQFCLNSYFEDLNLHFEGGFELDRSQPLPADELADPTGVFLVARLQGDPIACAGLRLHPDGFGEVKRMWVASSARGLGLGRRMLSEVESEALRRGMVTLRLDTNRSLQEAIGLYRSSGFIEIERYNEEVYAHHWFEKRLVPKES
jgi:DNA-binding MarR family transcriptional regulator/GNAT superfamily N-acetyltransferase